MTSDLVHSIVGLMHEILAPDLGVKREEVSSWVEYT